MKIKKLSLDYLGFVLPFFLAVVCILSVSFGSIQAAMAIPMPMEFEGEYSYDGENWSALTEDAEISALEGDLFLRGHFLREMSEGGLLIFYRNHIGVSISVNGSTLYQNEIFHRQEFNNRMFSSMCGRAWESILSPEILPDDLVEIQLSNPHTWGNRSAYRDFLTTLCVGFPGWSILQDALEPYGKPSRIIASVLLSASLMLLGAAAASVTVRIPIGGTMLKLGLLTLTAGGFFAFDTLDVFFWNDLGVLNTYVSQLCMMLALLVFGYYVSDALTGRKRRIVRQALMVSGLVNCVLILFSFTGIMVLFDTLPYWIASQVILCPLLFFCCVLELRQTVDRGHLRLYSGLLLSSAVLLDVAGVGSTIVWRSPCSKLIFLFLFILHIVAGAKSVVLEHRASIRAEKLERELEDSRIAIMLSQIKPHFLYNVLNTIYHLYRKEPETAQEAVNSFAEYLRCNMLSIEKNELIPFQEEYQHIQTYLSLEQIRFRGKLEVVYDVEATDFMLPPLTVEPLVENAVKHGVTKKRGGGTVTISTRRQGNDYLVTVSDTGIGFDPDHYMEDGKPHIGIRNVRERLQSMAGGSLTISSTPEGTVAQVSIPAKEGKG